MKYVLFSISLFVAIFSWSQNKDIEILREININRNTNLDPFFTFMSDSDGAISILTPTSFFVVGLIKKDSITKRKALVMGGSLFISTCLTVVMKYGIKRPRPFVTYPEIQKLSPAGSPAFPSGHTSMAFSTATSLSLVYPKWYVIAPSFLWASSVGYSRMHLGVHYPSDVIVGALIGAGSAWLSNFLNKKLVRKSP